MGSPKQPGNQQDKKPGVLVSLHKEEPQHWPLQCSEAVADRGQQGRAGAKAVLGPASMLVRAGGKMANKGPVGVEATVLSQCRYGESHFIFSKEIM